MDVAQRLKLAGDTASKTVELARWVCLAARIEPHLLRRARLRFMARTNASVEADLWFGPLVQTRGARFVTLFPDVANSLRAEMAADRAMLASAWELVRETHSYLPELARLEEELVWLALRNGPDRERLLDERLRPVLKALLAGERKGLARWAAGTLPRLPVGARTETARLVRMVSEAQLYGGWMPLLEPGEEGETLSDEARALLFQGMERVEAGVQMFDGRLEVSEPPAAGAQLIRLPATNPRRLDVSWPAGGGSEDELKTARLTWPRPEPQQAEAAGQPPRAVLHDLAPPAALTTVTGDAYRVVSRRAATEQMNEKAAPFLVTLLDWNLNPCGTGVLIDDRHVVTTERNLLQLKSVIQPNASPLPSRSTALVRFPFLQDWNPTSARELRSTPTNPLFPDLENLTLLELHGPLPPGARPARLSQTAELPNRALMAFVHSPQNLDGSWACFEFSATEGDYPSLKLTANLTQPLAAWSGSPVIDKESGDVLGVFCLRGSRAVLRQVPRDFLDDRQPVRIFCSYSHRDERYVEELRQYLSPLEDRGFITLETDQEIAAGVMWREKIRYKLNEAEMILLLVSSDYLASDTYDEALRALERHEAGEAVVIPIILRESAWAQTAMAKLQALPTDGHPVSSWRNQDEAFTDIASGIQAAAEQIRQRRADVRREPPAERQRISNLPAERNPDFTGREEILSQLFAGFNAQGEAATPRQTLYGLDGAGKTSIALEYAYRHADQYDLIWWLRAESAATIEEDYLGLARRLNLTDAADAGSAATSLLKWLGGARRWLLIFDDASDIALDYSPYYPPQDFGHVLITFRSSLSQGSRGARPVNVWSSQEAIAFLLRQTGESDEAAAGQLAAALGYLPLALDQAATYIRAEKVSIADYFLLLKTREWEMLSSGGRSTRDSALVATVWEKSLQRISREYIQETRILQFGAFLASDPIPPPLIMRGLGFLDYVADRDSIIVPQARDFLLEDSMVNRAGDSFSIHPLVQTVVRHRMGPEQARQFAEQALVATESSFPADSDEPSAWPACSRLLPHAQAVLMHNESFKFPLPQVTRLINKMALYWLSQGDYRTVTEWLPRALAYEEEILHSPALRSVPLLNNLGVGWLGLAEFHMAGSALERGTKVYEETRGGESPYFAALLGNLGLVSLGRQAPERAEEYCQRALETNASVYGSGHPMVGVDMINLGVVMFHLGAAENARGMTQQGYEIIIRHRQPSQDEALCLNNLGVLNLTLGLHSRAEEMFRRALDIRERLLGAEHPRTRQSRERLGLLGISVSEVMRAGPVTGVESLAAHLETRPKVIRIEDVDRDISGPNHPPFAA
jgi:tetratricopeptide (TPR) repeat protein